MKSEDLVLSPQSSNPRASLVSIFFSESGKTSSIKPHISSLIFFLFAETAFHFLQLSSVSSLSFFVTFFALPAFSVSSLSKISAFSVSRAETLETRSVVERVELRDERVLRNVLEVVRALAVEARREVMVVSRAVSCSGVMLSLGSWGGSVCDDNYQRTRETYLKRMVDDLLALSTCQRVNGM